MLQAPDSEGKVALGVMCVSGMPVMTLGQLNVVISFCGVAGSEICDQAIVGGLQCFRICDLLGWGG